MHLVICLNPTLQKTLLLPAFRENEVNRTGTYHLDASGKGVNVARVLSQLGEEAVHLTHAGGLFRGLFLSLAERDGLRLVAPDSASEVRTCYTLLNLAGGTTTEIVEEPEPVGPGTEALVREGFARLLPEAALLILSGTRARGYSEGLYADFVREAKKAGKRVLLDLRGKDLLACLPEGPDAVKPNLAEFVSTFLAEAPGSEHSEDPALLEAAAKKMEELHSRYGVCTVLTRGRLPTMYCDGRGVRTLAPERIEARNTTGSGDAFAAGFAAAWARGGFLGFGGPGGEKLFDAAVREGHRCGSLNAREVRPGRI